MMTILEFDALNKDIRAILKTLDVKWKDGGHLLTTANRICYLIAPLLENRKTQAERTIEAVKLLVE